MTDPKQTCSPHGWTLDTLERFLSDRIDALRDSIGAQDQQNKERFAAAKEQVMLALTSADKAIVKADSATERRFEGVNEFRATLADQAATLLPRSEYTVQHQALTARVETVANALATKSDENTARIAMIETAQLTKKETSSSTIAVIDLRHHRIDRCGSRVDVEALMRTALTLMLALLATAASAHSWYDQQCCGERDCRPVPCEQLVEDNNGSWLYIPTGNRFDSLQVKPSQDRHCHVCISSGRSLCVFIQTGT